MISDTLADLVILLLASALGYYLGGAFGMLGAILGFLIVCTVRAIAK